MTVRHVEAVAVVLRGGPDYRQPGDPFAWACYVTRSDLDTGYVLAMIGQPTLADFRRARAELRALGFARLTYTRVNGREGVFRL